MMRKPWSNPGFQEAIRGNTTNQAVKSGGEIRWRIERIRIDGGGDYIKHGTKDAYFKVSNTLPASMTPTEDLEEYWRKVVVDVTTAAPSAPSTSNAENADLDADTKTKLFNLSKWL